LTRSAIRQAVIRRARGRRPTRIGARVHAESAPSDPVAGFLLRSAVVSGWPGLEITAYTDLAGTRPIDPVRMDRLAPDVLLVLYAQLPARIEFDEPKEGLAFGLEDDGTANLRSVMGADIGTRLGDVALAPTYRRSHDVLRVDAWQQYL